MVSVISILSLLKKILITLKFASRFHRHHFSITAEFWIVFSMFWDTTSNKIFVLFSFFATGHVCVTSSLVSDNICDDTGRNELLGELHAVGTFYFLQSCQRSVYDFCLRDAHHPDEHAGEALIF